MRGVVQTCNGVADQQLSHESKAASFGQDTSKLYEHDGGQKPWRAEIPAAPGQKAAAKAGLVVLFTPLCIALRVSSVKSKYLLLIASSSSASASRFGAHEAGEPSCLLVAIALHSLHTSARLSDIPILGVVCHTAGRLSPNFSQVAHASHPHLSLRSQAL